MLENEELRSFFEFLISNKASSSYTAALEGYVNDAKHNMQWRVQYMTYERIRTYAIDEGMEKKAIEDVKSLLQLNKLTPEEIAAAIHVPLPTVRELQEQLNQKKTAKA